MKNLKFIPVSVFTACFILGCASPQKISFTPWNTDTAHWNQYQLNGVQFSAPAELPRVWSGPRMLAFCLSGWKSDAYSPGPYIPDEAVYVSCREQGKIQSDDMDKFISAVQKQRGYLKKVSQPISGYHFWRPSAYNNADNSDGIKDTTVIVEIDWGYLFYLHDPQVCNVYIKKWCGSSYSQLDVDKYVSPEEKKLVEDIVSTMKPVQ
jgi:hypothetical protein